MFTFTAKEITDLRKRLDELITEKLVIEATLALFGGNPKPKKAVRRVRKVRRVQKVQKVRKVQKLPRIVEKANEIARQSLDPHLIPKVTPLGFHDKVIIEVSHLLRGNRGGMPYADVVKHLKASSGVFEHVKQVNKVFAAELAKEIEKESPALRSVGKDVYLSDFISDPEPE